MDHAREPLPGEHIEQVLAIGKIDLFEPELLVVLQNGEPRLLQGGIVVRVHAVEADNDAPLLQQLLRDMEADEAGSSRDEHRVLRHRGSPTRRHGRRMIALSVMAELLLRNYPA